MKGNGRGAAWPRPFPCPPAHSIGCKPGSLCRAAAARVDCRQRRSICAPPRGAPGLIAFEWAIGLERLSPLAVVAIGGLVVSTFLSLVYVPLIYDLLENLRSRFTHGAAPALPNAAEERG